MNAILATKPEHGTETQMTLLAAAQRGGLSDSPASTMPAVAPLWAGHSLAHFIRGFSPTAICCRSFAAPENTPGAQQTMCSQFLEGV